MDRKDLTDIAKKFLRIRFFEESLDDLFLKQKIIMSRLKDKVAIITGAGRGIGREICLYLASEGARIVVNDLGGDRDGSGEITYDEFLRSIRGRMNPAREALARKAFKIMDKDGSGKLDMNDIRGVYDAKNHPDVKSGKKTEDEILGEFLDTFEAHYADQKGHEDSRDGVIKMDEWLEYYNNVSMSIDTDDYFSTMMNSAWNLDGKRVTKKGWGGEV